MQPLDPVAASSTSELLRGMARTAFTGRSLGEAADVMEAMLRDDCWVVMTLSGAKLAILSREALAEIETIAQKMTYIDLSSNNKFMEEYSSALFLPHTNLELFPSVQ